MKGRSAAAAPPKLIRTNPLPRGSACLHCRKRRVRCDSAKPSCAACLRNAKFNNEECKCAYAAPSDRKKRNPSLAAYNLPLKDQARRTRATERRNELVEGAGDADSDAFHATLHWQPDPTDGQHCRPLGADAATPFRGLTSADETPSPSSPTLASHCSFTEIQSLNPYDPASMQLAPASPPSHLLASASFATDQPFWPWKYPITPYTDLDPMKVLDPEVRRWIEGVPTYQSAPAAPDGVAYPPFLRDPQPPPVPPDLYWPVLENNTRRQESIRPGGWWEDGAYVDWDSLTVCDGPQ